MENELELYFKIEVTKRATIPELLRAAADDYEQLLISGKEEDVIKEGGWNFTKLDSPKNVRRLAMTRLVHDDGSDELAMAKERVARKDKPSDKPRNK